MSLLIVPGIPTLNCPPTSHKSPNPPGRTSALCPAYYMDLNALLLFFWHAPPAPPRAVDWGRRGALILSFGGMLSAMPACLFAWPVFCHCQYLLDSNSKHGIPLGSPFLPVPRERAFQMQHKCAFPAASPLLILPGITREQDVAASSCVAEASGVMVRLSLRIKCVFCKELSVNALLRKLEPKTFTRVLQGGQELC